MSKAKFRLFPSFFMGLPTLTDYIFHVMASGRKNIRIVRKLRLVVLLAVFYFVFTVAYYFLPWNTRRPIYRKLPLIDRTLVQTGYRIMDGLDGLGLQGKDCRAVLEQRQGEAHAYGGYPADGFQFFECDRILENESYIVGYSESLKNPLWVAYRIFDVPELHSGKRPSFRIDHRTDTKVSPKDYRGSGYDRGHMAPNFAIATRYGPMGQYETFLMSNIIPQTPMINRYIWKDLEQRIARRYGRYFGEVWVVTGPVFSKPVKRLSSGVAIPTAYYKIVVDEDDDGLRAMAFLVSRYTAPYTRIKTRLVSIDELEGITGLDFFPELSKEEQLALESYAAGRLWPWLGSALRYMF